MFKFRPSFNKKKRKKVDSSKESFLVFHGTNCEIRPDNFDFSMADNESDFGPAIYFGLTFKSAARWSRTSKGPDVVNWYVFNQRAAKDHGVKIHYFDSPIEWLDATLSFVEHEYKGDEDIFVGDMMDARTDQVLHKYKSIAESKGIRLSELDEITKYRMLDELNPEHFDQQIAIRNEKGLKHLHFIGSIEVTDMETSTYIDPADVVADVAAIIVNRDGLSQNEAITHFMSSKTGKSLMTNPDMVLKSPEEILDMYDREVRRSG